MIKKLYAHFMGDSLYRNSIYLMLSTGVMAFFGFFFWIINARIFTPEQIGLATTMISIASLISSFSLLGLNIGLVHYLPTSTQKNDKINTSFTLIFLTAVVLSMGYVVGIQFFSPKLAFLVHNPFAFIAFIIMIAAISLNSIIDTVFVAYRSTHFVLIKNTVLSITKLLFPLVFFTFGAFGIFMGFGLSSLIAFSLGIIFLMRKFEYEIKPDIHTGVIKKMITFSFGNYIAGFIGLLPMNMLPILITNKIGAPTAAYFYICMMIANLLYIIPMATSQSLFAEGSYSNEEMKQHLKKTIQIIFLLLIPTIGLILFFGNFVLAAFGKNYVSEGFSFLRLIACGAIFYSISQVGYVLLNIDKKPQYNIYLNSVNAVIIFALSFILLPYNLLGIGIAWVCGQAVTALLYIMLLRKFFS